MTVVLAGLALFALLVAFRRVRRRRSTSAALALAVPAAVDPVAAAWCSGRDPFTGRPDRLEF